jgi:chromodomain-helicase-DNA-binding protein 7
VSENRVDIDINDPNFWDKWAKLSDLDVDSLNSKNELIVKEPRQRKQTSRYGNEEAALDMSDLESSSDTDDELKLLRKGRKTRRSGRGQDMDFTPAEDISSAGYTRNDCFKVEKSLLVFG